MRLYDADGRDRPVELEAGMASRVGAKQLLWVDLDRHDRDELDAVAAAVGLAPGVVDRLATPSDRPDLTQYPEAWRCKCGNKLFMP